MLLPKGDILTLFIRTLFYLIPSCSLNVARSGIMRHLKSSSPSTQPRSSVLSKYIKGKELLDTPFFPSLSLHERRKNKSKERRCIHSTPDTASSGIPAGYLPPLVAR